MAVSTPPVEHQIPLSIEGLPALDTSGPETTSPAPRADFGADEIDGLVGEVQETADVSPALSATDEQDDVSVVEPQDSPAEEPEEVPEIQLEADVSPSETVSEPPLVDTDEMPRIEVNVQAVPGEESTPEAAEVLSDTDLFRDPSLEIAHLAAGQQREIVIPVQIAGEGESFKRYKLSLRLKLDPVD